jgi:hypothetical protein
MLGGIVGGGIDVIDGAPYHCEPAVTVPLLKSPRMKNWTSRIKNWTSRPELDMGAGVFWACARAIVRLATRRRKSMPQNSPFMGTITRWQTDANTGNTTDIRKLYQTDAVGLFTEGTDPTPPGNPSAMIQGADHIVADLGKHFGPNNPFQNVQLVEVGWQQQGNAGYSYGTWTANVPQPLPPNGSWCAIWVQGSGDTPWLIQLQAVVPAIPEQQ